MPFILLSHTVYLPASTSHSRRLLVIPASISRLCRISHQLDCQIPCIMAAKSTDIDPDDNRRQILDQLEDGLDPYKVLDLDFARDSVVYNADKISSAHRRAAMKTQRPGGSTAWSLVEVNRAYNAMNNEHAWRHTSRRVRAWLLSPESRPEYNGQNISLEPALPAQP